MNDWKMFKGGTGRVEAEQGQEERKRTGVDSKHDNRNNQDNPALVRGEDPSPPDDDVVGDDILNQIPGDGPVHGDVSR